MFSFAVFLCCGLCVSVPYAETRVCRCRDVVNVLMVGHVGFGKCVGSGEGSVGVWVLGTCPDPVSLFSCRFFAQNRSWFQTGVMSKQGSKTGQKIKFKRQNEKMKSEFQRQMTKVKGRKDN